MDPLAIFIYQYGTWASILLPAMQKMYTQQQSEEERMNINAIIQVAIGIMFIWIALAMVTSQTQEWIASLFKTRAKMLEDAIGNLFSNDKDLKEKFYNHPLIRGLHTNRGNRKPGGIPEDKFALVLFDMIMSEGQDAETRSKSSFDQLINGIEK